MLELIMQITWEELIPVATVLGFLALFTVVWNASKKITTMEADIETLTQLHKTDIEEIKERRTEYLLEYSNKIQEIAKELTAKIGEAKLERREEIQKALLNSKDEFSSQQRQIDSVRSDVKDGSTRVTEVNTKISFLENDIDRLEKCDADTKDMLLKLLHRLEDKVDKLDNLDSRNKT